MTGQDRFALAVATALDNMRTIATGARLQDVEALARAAEAHFPGVTERSRLACLEGITSGDTSH
jgi:hypothetical protein